MSGIRNLLSFSVFVLATATVQRPAVIQEANVMYLSKRATNKDWSLNMRLLLLSDDKPSLDTELIWLQNGYFDDQKGEFTLNKVNFPENTPIYANQGSISTLKGGEHAIYLDYVILGQLICAKTMPKDFENYECSENEVKLCVPLYNIETGEFKDLQKWLAYIIVRGGEDEMFLSYGFDEDKSNVLYSNYKLILPNIFQGTSFKKYNPMLLNERSVQERSKMFFFLSSTTDRKEKIDQFLKNVSLHPTDCHYEDFRKCSANGRDFYPQDLDSSDMEKRLAAREIVVNFFKDPVQVSNSNLMRYANTLLTSGLIGKSGKREQEKFKFTY